MTWLETFDDLDRMWVEFLETVDHDYPFTVDWSARSITFTVRRNRDV